MARREKRNWSQDVTAHSDALDLEPEVFAKANPDAIAQSLKQSAEASRRRKGTAFQSAMSMLTFYMNRAGRNLPEPRKRTLEAAKSALRRLFGRAPYLPQPPSEGARDTGGGEATARRRPRD